MSIQINLLPWREKRREKQKKLFFIALGVSVGVSLCLAAGIYFLLNHKMDAQRFRNQLLSDEIAQYDQKLKEINQLKKVKAALIARMNIIQQLQESRPMIVHFFDELAKIVPEGIHLQEVKRDSDMITLTGRAASNTDVSHLMRNVEKSFWLHQPYLEKIQELSELRGQKREKVYFNEFELKFILKSPQALKLGL